jgi:hypothetical protein
MTRPGLFTYLFGNPFSYFGSLGLLAYFLYQAAMVNGEYGAVIWTSILAARCWHCASKVQAYGRWKREWAMATGNGRKPLLAAMSPAARSVVALGLWFGMAAFTIATVGPEYRTLANDWFWVGNGGIGLVVIGKLVGRWITQRQRPSSKPFDVRVCLPKPMFSPDFRQSYSQLPDYCRNILVGKE